MNGSARLDRSPSRARALRLLGGSKAVSTTYEDRGARPVPSETQRSADIRRGYDDGYAEGMARSTEDAERARREASEQAATGLAALVRAVEATTEADRRRWVEFEETVPRLVFDLLEALLGREVDVMSDPGRAAIVRALAQDDGVEDAVVRLNPVDVATLGDLGDLRAHRELRVVADATVERGGALVALGGATVDSRLSTALERVKKVLVSTSEPGVHDDQSGRQRAGGGDDRAP